MSTRFIHWSGVTIMLGGLIVVLGAFLPDYTLWKLPSRKSVPQG